MYDGDDINLLMEEDLDVESEKLWAKGVKKVLKKQKEMIK